MWPSGANHHPLRSVTELVYGVVAPRTFALPRSAQVGGVLADATAHSDGGTTPDPGGAERGGCDRATVDPSHAASTPTATAIAVDITVVRKAFTTSQLSSRAAGRRNARTAPASRTHQF